MNRSGFSLIEVLIVVVIIGIIIVIAVPQILSAKIAANETWASTFLRNWVIGQQIYHLKTGTYAPTPHDLIASQCIGAPDPGGTNPSTCGYTFQITVEADGTAWSGTAVPIVPGKTGRTYYFVDGRSGTIHANNMAPADASSPAYSQ